MVFTGKILEITKKSGTSKTGNEWVALDVHAIEAGAEYPAEILFTVFGDEKVAAFEQNCAVGNVMSFSLNTRVTEYNGRKYCNISAWRWSVAAQVQHTPPSAPSAPNAPAAMPKTGQQQAPQAEPEGDDLPF